MSGETRGRVCEALIVKVLREISLPDLYSGLTVVWDKPVPDLPIRPDVTLRDADDNVRLLIQVTYSGSETDERQKFWRDFAELADFRLNFSYPVIYITYLSAGRVKLGKAAMATRNGALTVAELPSGEDLVKLVLETTEELAESPSQDEILIALNQKIAGGKYAQGIDSLKNELSMLISRSSEEITSFWKVVQNTSIRRVSIRTSHKKTYIRPGVALLTIFPSEYRHLIYKNIEEGAELPVGPAYAVTCGLIQNFEHNSKIINPKIVDAINRLGSSSIERIIQADSGKRDYYIQQIRELGTLTQQIEWVVNHYSDVTDPQKLSTLLQQCFERSLSWDGSDEHASPNCWLYSSIKSILRTFFGRDQLWIAAVVAETGLLKSVVKGLHLPKFERLEKPLSQEIHSAVAKAFANRLSEISPSEITSKILNTVDKNRAHLIGNGLLSNGIDPVGTLINLTLNGSISLCRLQSSISTWLRETRRDTSFNVNDLATEGYLANSTFIKWQTAYEGHQTDKTKELCGRAGHFRAVWNNTSQEFEARENISRYILVIDGDWNLGQIERLYKAGWELILYPDELDSLPSLIL